MEFLKLKHLCIEVKHTYFTISYLYRDVGTLDYFGGQLRYIKEGRGCNGS